jgi:hypothetical protein
MAQAKKSKKKISNAIGEVLKTPKKAEKAVKKASTDWSSLQEFRQQVIDSGIVLDIADEYEYYARDPENFKKTNTYYRLTNSGKNNPNIVRHPDETDL